MNESIVELRTESGKEPGSPEILLHRFLADETFENPCWSWFEPKPGTLFNAPSLTVGDLHPLLRKGPPVIPDGIEAAEIKLFWPDRALFLQGIDRQHSRWFCWRIESGGVNCRKQSSRVLIKEPATWKQYGLAADQGYPEFMWIDQYFWRNECVAWTLIDFQEEGGTDAEG